MNETTTYHENIPQGYVEEVHYPGLLERVKAIVIDNVLVLGSLFLVSAIISAFGGAPDSVRIICLLFIFFLYDPLFTSIFGGTVGHMIMGLRVKKEHDVGKNVIFPLAMVRFIAKVFLGGISLITVSTNARKRAIHDQIAGTIVVYAGRK
ncbi:RDD family protein [Sphingobacterium alkalisoli]|uniref:RDD family protein n=1 Tax=Sphingobacterium alkalisoli TaxID=1874115 RepID=A0A4U0H4S4_9SPHI|nr:RDD family protein [Sphingobacterium alkalisoli]TJY66680.1 RDD family protein [Sphingobacterium alkalisoli]GGH14857.1 hypothetical protein GCM10011418_16120 [Sphingobacterium alkalisoli]